MTVGELESVQLGDVRAVTESLRALVAMLEPDAVQLFAAPALCAEFAAVKTLAASAETLLARRAEAACTWKREGFRSAAEQLASVSGTSVASARNMLETSKQVAELPATADAMRAGVLSPEKAQAIASAATVAPDAEQKLLATAGKPLAEVRDASLQARAGVDRDAAHKRIRKERYAKEYPDAEGAWNFRARGTPDKGAEFRVAFDPIVDEMFKRARAEGRNETREAYAFDALLEMARRAAGSGAGDKTKTPSPRFMALVRADVEALQRGHVEGDEVCEISGLGPIPVRTARDLLGDAILKLVITKGVDVTNVTHLGRSPTVAQQVALWWRSPMCTNENCTHSRRLQNDHRDGWAQTHITYLDSLDPLCDHDHDLKTYFGWALVDGKGRRPLVAPDNPRHPRYRAPPD